MKLTVEQLTEIKAYIQDMGIKYLDVQMEILDHATCKVEEKMNADSTLSFDDAFYQTTREFGYLEYKEFEESFKKTLIRQQTKLNRNAMKEWLEIPKLPYTVAVLLCSFLLFILLGVKWASIALSIVVISLTLWVTFEQFFRYLKYRRMMNLSYFNYIPSMNILYFWMISREHISNSWSWGVGFSFLSLICFVLIYGSYTSGNYMYKRTIDLTNLYGQLNLKSS
jgi:hypothetical protein